MTSRSVLPFRTGAQSVWRRHTGCGPQLLPKRCATSDSWMIHKMFFINQAKSKTNSLMSTCSYSWVRNGWKPASVPITALGKQCFVFLIHFYPFPFWSQEQQHWDSAHITHPLCRTRTVFISQCCKQLKPLITVRLLAQGLAHSKYNRIYFITTMVTATTALLL